MHLSSLKLRFNCSSWQNRPARIYLETPSIDISQPSNRYFTFSENTQNKIPCYVILKQDNDPISISETNPLAKIYHGSLEECFFELQIWKQSKHQPVLFSSGSGTYTFAEPVKIINQGTTKGRLYCTLECSKGLKVQNLHLIGILRLGSHVYVSERTPFAPPSSRKRKRESSDYEKKNIRIAEEIISITNIVQSCDSDGILNTIANWVKNEGVQNRPGLAQALNSIYFFGFLTENASNKILERALKSEPSWQGCFLIRISIDTPNKFLFQVILNGGKGSLVKYKALMKFTQFRNKEIFSINHLGKGTFFDSMESSVQHFASVTCTIPLTRTMFSPSLERSLVIPTPGFLNGSVLGSQGSSGQTPVLDIFQNDVQSHPYQNINNAHSYSKNFQSNTSFGESISQYSTQRTPTTGIPQIPLNQAQISFSNSSGSNNNNNNNSNSSSSNNNNNNNNSTSTTTTTTTTTTTNATTTATSTTKNTNSTNNTVTSSTTSDSSPTGKLLNSFDSNGAPDATTGIIKSVKLEKPKNNIRKVVERLSNTTSGEIISNLNKDIIEPKSNQNTAVSTNFKHSTGKPPLTNKNTLFMNNAQLFKSPNVLLPNNSSIISNNQSLLQSGSVPTFFTNNSSLFSNPSNSLHANPVSAFSNNPNQYSSASPNFTFVNLCIQQRNRNNDNIVDSILDSQSLENFNSNNNIVDNSKSTSMSPVISHSNLSPSSNTSTDTSPVYSSFSGCQSWPEESSFSQYLESQGVAAFNPARAVVNLPFCETSMTCSFPAVNQFDTGFFLTDSR